MNVFIIPSSYPSQQKPMVNRFIYEQAKTLHALGHHVVVLHVQQKGTKECYRIASNEIQRFDDEFATRYMITSNTFMEKHFPRLNQTIFCSKMMRLFRTAIEQEEMPDVLYAHFSLYAGYAAGKIKQAYGIPLVTLEHYSRLLFPRIKPIEKQYLRFVIQTSDVFACVSETLKQSIERHTGIVQKIKVIPNMIDDCFQYFPKKAGEKMTFLAIGNLNPGKRFDLLINAFCQAFDRDDPSVQLLIGGNGELRRYLKNLIKNKNREKQIHLLGGLSRQATLEAYRNCDCFVLPSAAETFGIVYREALAVGRPIITTDHGGFSKQDWDDRFGIKIPVDDQAALVNALREMKHHSSEYDGQLISKLCLQKHHPLVIGSIVNDVLEQAAKNQKTNG